VGLAVQVIACIYDPKGRRTHMPVEIDVRGLVYGLYLSISRHISELACEGACLCLGVRSDEVLSKLGSRCVRVGEHPQRNGTELDRGLHSMYRGRRGKARRGDLRLGCGMEEIVGADLGWVGTNEGIVVVARLTRSKC
jgi:hypothetical protein